ncbi:hypothetical protein EVAR_14017_1 [Eumeta japonica]|uniref:Uncharacterized protein n=1 Tax=Eumeta variegata TaxID=151549 RepID=A0A4C1XDJ3_EUMVA|nr:hypothetical protein EVAR_14017_1 [Eumeta japonica]
MEPRLGTHIQTVLMRMRLAHLPPVLTYKYDITEIDQMQKGKFNISVKKLLSKFRDKSRELEFIQLSATSSLDCRLLLNLAARSSPLPRGRVSWVRPDLASPSSKHACSTSHAPGVRAS